MDQLTDKPRWGFSVPDHKKMVTNRKQVVLMQKRDPGKYALTKPIFNVFENSADRGTDKVTNW